MFIDKSNLDSATSMSDLPILSLQHEVVTLEGSLEPYTLAQKLVRWNRTQGSNEVEVIFDIFEVMPPPPARASRSFTVVRRLTPRTHTVSACSLLSLSCSPSF